LAKKNQLYEGKAKKIILADDPDQVIMKFKDNTPEGAKKGIIKGKGAINNQISAHLFKYLESYNVPTHFIEELNETEILVKKLDIIKVEVVMHNIAAGSLCKRYGLEEGSELPLPILEYNLKNDDLNDPMVNEYHIYAMQLATQNELQIISKLAIKVNAILKSFFQRRKTMLIDFKLEFGRFGDKILLGDEISPDTCTFWDIQSKGKFDKDRFRLDSGKIEDIYKEMLSRVLE
jgi:phosphoribosylaminoimidazole-succinocarboxamide synthase